jgi:mRNA-degrading endonuclease YafQ of YafQ-DinJ toxin-antitoxin module
MSMRDMIKPGNIRNITFIITISGSTIIFNQDNNDNNLKGKYKDIIPKKIFKYQIILIYLICDSNSLRLISNLSLLSSAK